MADHPNKHIREAIDYAENRGWRVQKAGGHAHIWGTLFCPLQTRGGCIFNVHSTPRNPEAHSKRIIRAVDSCDHY
ncbi:MAG: hypothetical protein QGF00_19040 [Planctomycetota bacterium]|nr:hypothetical protein [Planctomycetota bacterium]MDP7251712.1 hypothetical protein [Planctomycetota bacterium]